MNPQTTQTIAVFDSELLHFFALFEEHAGEEILATNSEDGDLVLWAKDDSFPISVLNAGTPGIETWEGEPVVVNEVHSLIEEGYSFEITCREKDDGTAFNATHSQDYKLVIRKNG